MIFTVPENFEGSFVLSTLKKVLSRGMSISICGNDLYALDVKMAIKKGMLVSIGDEYREEHANRSNSAMIVNRTDRVLVLGGLILRPWASLLVDKSSINDAVIQSAENNGFINVVSDENNLSSNKFKKYSSKDREKNITDYTNDIKPDIKPDFVVGADRKVKAKVWNFREQESEDAEIVPIAPDIINVIEKDSEDIEFVDEPIVIEEGPSQLNKKTIKKKTINNTNKKKVLTSKKKKVKAIEPIGEKKILKNKMEVSIELDSRGRPLVEGGVDALAHLIDSLNDSEEVSFVDDEQAHDRINNKIDMD